MQPGMREFIDMNAKLHVGLGSLLAIFLGSAALAQSRAISEGTQAQDVVNASGAGTKDALATSGMPDGVAKLQGILVYVKGGRGTRITGEQKFTEGLTVQRGGDILLSDGRKLKLTEGQMVTFSGELREAPRNIELPKPLAGKAKPERRTK